MKRRVLTKEFKLEAVRLSNESGKSIQQVAKDLGVPRNTLNSWRTEYRSDAADAFPGNGKRTEMEQRLWQLERENERLKRERETLGACLTAISM
jgi:transposase